MRITQTRFIKSATSLEQCPPDDKPEYAFIGRSNVGKSSLINMICNQKDLAKTSGRPGKTQLLNFFLINEAWNLVDLPGYGYAKVSKSIRSQFESMIGGYMNGRKNLQCVFVLIDARHDLQKLDLEFMIRLGEKEIPFCIVFTKCDKLSTRALPKQIKSITDDILNYWEELPEYFLTSASSKKGREDLLDFIGELIQVWEKQK
jgi:GTP-binding protein